MQVQTFKHLFSHIIVSMFYRFNKVLSLMSFLVKIGLERGQFTSTNLKVVYNIIFENAMFP